MKDLGAAKKILAMEITRDKSVGSFSCLNSIVSRYMACPRKEHWQAEKWIMRYLKDTVDVGLIFDRAKMSDLFVGYVDLDFTGDLNKRRSLTSYLFSLSGSAIS
ncbi:hypothetical protein GH714_038482 [Hevea brasiliensis]|uniref:Reverse transcriptase Ty1/copia-type domain-containing protein n=1 Tax=Hevea brasiliensis TaxID=3981 RepID=A0A6A6KMN9_HEVBR|nr:hypothetical protein GH714_038482 [Hevea brasiliensis]